jgi:hypothetical protein
MRKSVDNRKQDVCGRYKNSCEMSSTRLSKGSLRPVRRHESESLRDIASINTARRTARLSRGASILDRRIL